MRMMSGSFSSFSSRIAFCTLVLKIMISHGRHAADARLDALEQLLGDDALHVEGDGAAQGGVHVLREQVENTADRGRRRCEAWIVPNTKWPVSAAWMAVMNVSWSRISPTSMTSGSSRTACFMPMLEVDDVEADLALVDQALVFGEHEFDRVFEREDVLAVAVVDPVEHRGDRRALAGAGDAGQQDHALIVVAELLDRRRQVQALEVGNRSC